MAEVPLKYALPILALAAIPLAYVVVGPLVAARSPTPLMANHYTEKEADDTSFACDAMERHLDPQIKSQVDRTGCDVDFSTATAVLTVLLLRNKQGEKLKQTYVGHIERIDKDKWDATNVALGIAPKPLGVLFNAYDAYRANMACITAKADTEDQFFLLLENQDAKDCEVTFDSKKSAIVTLNYITNEKPSRRRKYMVRVIKDTSRHPLPGTGWVTAAIGNYD